tara:strand:+ start:259 stop:471 length:213 start_codon:yes stop_codon:yes gene_type:complete
MPTKFKPDSFEYIGLRSSRKQIKVRNFMSATSKKELIDYINNAYGKPKIKQKCKNELTRRGVKLRWVSDV